MVWKITAYELSEHCALNLSMKRCEHFDGVGFIVLTEHVKKQFERSDDWHRTLYEHVCPNCVPKEAQVFTAEWPRRIRYLIANEETRVKSPSRRPSNRW